MSKLKYIKKVTVAGDTIEVEKTQSARYGRKIPRGEKEKPTPKDVEEVNRRNAEKELTRILNENFYPGDYHLELTYYNECYPKTTEEWTNHREEFKRRMRQEAKTRGEQFFYVEVPEGPPHRYHSHFVIRAIDVKTLYRLWPYGGIRIYPLWDKREYSKLAAYLIKQTAKILNKPGSVCKKRWTGSKNLIHPKPDCKVVSASTWRKEPKPLKGYEIIKDSVENFTNKYTGRDSQFYRMIRIVPLQESEKRRERAQQLREQTAREKKKPNENRRC